MDDLVRLILLDLANGDDILSLEAKSILFKSELKSIICSTFNLLENKSVLINAFDIPGLFYIKNYLSESEIEFCMDKIKSEIKFEPISLSTNSRMVAHYGYYYSYDRSGLKPAPPIPNYLADLANLVRINDECRSDVVSAQFDQLIINKYKPDQQISPHTDHLAQFGPVIACITAPCDYSRALLGYNLR